MLLCLATISASPASVPIMLGAMSKLYSSRRRIRTPQTRSSLPCVVHIAVRWYAIGAGVALLCLCVTAPLSIWCPAENAAEAVLCHWLALSSCVLLLASVEVLAAEWWTERAARRQMGELLLNGVGEQLSAVEEKVEEVSRTTVAQADAVRELQQTTDQLGGRMQGEPLHELNEGVVALGVGFDHNPPKRQEGSGLFVHDSGLLISCHHVLLHMQAEQMPTPSASRQYWVGLGDPIQWIYEAQVEASSACDDCGGQDKPWLDLVIWRLRCRRCNGGSERLRIPIEHPPFQRKEGEPRLSRPIR